MQQSKQYALNVGLRCQLGLESSLDLYFIHMLQITKELKRVLKKSGLLFWVHGNSYGGTSPKGKFRDPKYSEGRNLDVYPSGKGWTPKCMTDQNFRLSIKMVDEQGWIKRNNIVWRKPNSLPSPVKDRLSNNYEMIFMFAKGKKYYSDLDAIREPHKAESLKRVESGWHGNLCEGHAMSGIKDTDKMNTCHPLGKNIGDIWDINTQPRPELHYASFPDSLVEKCLKFGCSTKICNECDIPSVRIVDKSYTPTRPGLKTGSGKSGTDLDPNKSLHQQDISKYRMKIEYKTTGWDTCNCNVGFHSGIVLDPFSGIGTVGFVARKMGINFLGFEICPEYVEIANKRIPTVLSDFEED